MSVCVNEYFANEQHVCELQEGQTNHEQAIQVKRFNSIGPKTKTKTNHKKKKKIKQKVDLINFIVHSLS